MSFRSIYLAIYGDDYANKLLVYPMNVILNRVDTVMRRFKVLESSGVATIIYGAERTERIKHFIRHLNLERDIWDVKVLIKIVKTPVHNTMIKHYYVNVTAVRRTFCFGLSVDDEIHQQIFFVARSIESDELLQFREQRELERSAFMEKRQLELEIKPTKTKIEKRL